MQASTKALYSRSHAAGDTGSGGGSQWNGHLCQEHAAPCSLCVPNMVATSEVLRAQGDLS